MTLIKINGNVLDPQAPTVSALGLQADNACDSDYILIQTRPGPLKQYMQRELEHMEVFVLEKVSQDTYLCGYKLEDLEGIRALPYITSVNTYQQYFVLQAGLKSPGDPINGILPSANDTTAPITIYLQLHQDVEPTEAVVREVASAARIDPNFLSFSGGVARITVQQKYLDIIADIDVVKSIQKAYPVQLHNNVARKILNADVSIGGTPFRGEGQVVAVADTGFDKGDINDIPTPFAGRVAHLYAVGRPATATTPASADDPDGHGTHVCGSVLGDGTSAKMGGRIEAPASRATLVVQSLLDGTGALQTPGNLMDLFSPPYKEFGARIHTNSWGSGHDTAQPFAQFAYDIPAHNIDQFVWENRDMVILFSAGNDGSDADKNGVNDGPEIGSQACAKNCITVGATESLRKNGLVWDSARWGPPIANDPVADNAEGMAAFSSRGPTVEGRIKPDLVAPGTSILSTHSRNAGPITEWGTSTDPDWVFNGGTSMATPLVAGCCAVLRESWVKNGHNPSAALIKALLINGAVDVDRQYTPSEAGPSPNHSSGFGRVNLAGSIILPPSGGDTGNAGWNDDQHGIDKDDPPVVIEIDIPKGSPDPPKRLAALGLGEATNLSVGSSADEIRTTSAHAYPHPTLKVTLVWSDFPGATLQNDLDLTVVSVGGQRERHGNQGATEFSLGAKEVFDRVNNVEQVVWSNMPAGKAEIIVSGFNITQGPQSWAYAWRIY